MTGSPETQDLAITLGVEEEFFLVDPESRDLVADPDEGIFEACERSGGPHKVVHEFLRSQIETNTRGVRLGGGRARGAERGPGSWSSRRRRRTARG